MGVFTADSLASQGFIHCSTPAQAVHVANAYYVGARGLVLLRIDPARTSAELRFEPGVHEPEDRYPHLYGPLDVDAVVDVVDFEPGPDGRFSLPEALREPPPGR